MNVILIVNIVIIHYYSPQVGSVWYPVYLSGVLWMFQVSHLQLNTLHQ